MDSCPAEFGLLMAWFAFSDPSTAGKSWIPVLQNSVC